MQLVFLNTLEKQIEEGRVMRAQVSICERQGAWQVFWQDGDSASQTVWFEGTSWEEMIIAFRHGIAIKMGEGYIPLLDAMLDDRGSSRGAGGTISFLQCYGELHARPELFEALREWRRSKAVEQKKAAYLIATNRMLWMISAFVPHQENELLEIPGWGESKHSAYSGEVLAITQKFEQTTPFPLDWVMESLDPKTYTQWLYKQKETKYKNEMDRHQEKRRILGGIREGHTLADLQAALELPRRELIERIEQLEGEGYDLEGLIERELAEVPESERAKMWDALMIVGDRYLKPILNQVYTEEELKGRQVEQLYERLRLMRLRFRRNRTKAI
ncbi:HRDC domain-containing protein [Paenibacillus tarimensis]